MLDIPSMICVFQDASHRDPTFWFAISFSCSSDLHATRCLCVPTSMEGEWKLALSLHSSEMTRRDDTAQWHRQVTIGRQNSVDTVCLNIYYICVCVYQDSIQMYTV